LQANSPDNDAPRNDSTIFRKDPSYKAQAKNAKERNKIQVGHGRLRVRLVNIEIQESPNLEQQSQSKFKNQLKSKLVL
jgi:hypothetical protein